MKKLVIASTLIIALSSLTGMQATAGGEHGSIDATNAIIAAEAAIKKAASVNGEWRDSSSKFLKQAKAAADQGANSLAIKLANKAKFEGEMGYAQAMDQKNAGPWAF